MGNLFTNASTLFKEYKDFFVDKISLFGGRGGSSSVATLAIELSRRSDGKNVDLHFNFRRWQPGRINFNEVGKQEQTSLQGCELNIKGKEIRNTGIYFEEDETQTGYFSQHRFYDDSSLSKFKFAFITLLFQPHILRIGLPPTVSIKIGLINSTKPFKEAPQNPTHIVMLDILADYSIYSMTSLVPHFEEMQESAKLYSNSKEFEIYLTEEQYDDDDSNT